MDPKKPVRAQVQILKSGEIFNGAREVLIEHEKDYYRLIITRSGKLVLNK